MSRIGPAAVAFLALSSSNLAAQDADEQTLRAAMEEFCAAANRGDMEYIDRHYVPEVTRFHSTGELDVGSDERKANGLKAAAERGFAFAFERCDVVDARVYGEVGITAGHMYGHMTLANGSAVQGPWRFTYIWVRQGDEWKEAHHHVSLLEQN